MTSSPSVTATDTGVELGGLERPQRRAGHAHALTDRRGRAGGDRRRGLDRCRRAARRIGQTRGDRDIAGLGAVVDDVGDDVDDRVDAVDRPGGEPRSVGAHPDRTADQEVHRPVDARARVPAAVRHAAVVGHDLDEIVRAVVEEVVELDPEDGVAGRASAREPTVDEHLRTHVHALELEDDAASPPVLRRGERLGVPVGAAGEEAVVMAVGRVRVALLEQHGVVGQGDRPDRLVG